MLNRKEYLLTCLAEECNEVAQRVSKALRFGLDEIQPNQLMNNRERITQEFEDLVAVYNICVNENILPIAKDTTTTKLNKIEKYMKISISNNTLEG